MNLAKLEISSFNLLNLNEPGMPMYKDVDGWAQDVYDKKITWTASQISLLKPDVMGFQELWHAASLENALLASGLDSDYQLITPPNAAGQKIVCAAIVRKDLLVGAPEWISDFPPRMQLRAAGDDAQTPEIDIAVKGFSRPVLHFQILPRSDEPAVHVFVCHFKSKAPTQVSNEVWYKSDKPHYSKHANGIGSALSTIRRTAEACALRYILTELMKGTDTPVIVLGDINDGQHSNTANILTEQPEYLVGDSMGGGDIALYTAQTLQEYRDTRDVHYTHIHKDIRESLDHILVSEQFYDHSRKRRWLFAGLKINNDHLNQDDHKTSGTNDHGIIHASFKYKPIKNS